jgi:hypothetical protein
MRFFAPSAHPARRVHFPESVPAEVKLDEHSNGIAELACRPEAVCPSCRGRDDVPSRPAQQPTNRLFSCGRSVGRRGSGRRTARPLVPIRPVARSESSRRAVRRSLLRPVSIHGRSRFRMTGRRCLASCDPRVAFRVAHPGHRIVRIRRSGRLSASRANGLVPRHSGECGGRSRRYGAIVSPYGCLPDVRHSTNLARYGLAGEVVSSPVGHVRQRRTDEGRFLAESRIAVSRYGVVDRDPRRREGAGEGPRTRLLPEEQIGGCRLDGSDSSSRGSKPASVRLRRFQRPWRFAPLRASRHVSAGHAPGVRSPRRGSCRRRRWPR